MPTFVGQTIDGTTLQKTTLTIYLDRNGEDTLELGSLMNLTKYSLDVSGASVVRFYFDAGTSYQDSSFALADISVDGGKIARNHTVPTYETSEDFVRSCFNTKKLSVYDGSSKTSSFNMNGKTYYQGLVFNMYDRYAYAQYNVEEIDTLDFTLGHVDGTADRGTTFTICLDNVVYEEIPLTGSMENYHYTLDVAEVSVVRFFMDAGSNYVDASYALADMKIGDKKNSDSLSGDINNDGEVNVADAVLLQKWLLKVPGVKLPNMKAADLCEDGSIDIYDLAMLRKLLIAK